MKSGSGFVIQVIRVLGCASLVIVAAVLYDRIVYALSCLLSQ